jgi:hypothetical protein
VWYYGLGGIAYFAAKHPTGNLRRPRAGEQNAGNQTSKCRGIRSPHVGSSLSIH